MTDKNYKNYLRALQLLILGHCEMYCHGEPARPAVAWRSAGRTTTIHKAISHKYRSYILDEPERGRLSAKRGEERSP